MILFFYGANTFASRAKVRELVARYKKAAGNEFGLEKFDGQSAEAEQIVGSITSVPFLAKHRLIIIEDMLSNKALAEQVLPALKRIPDANVVVFYEHEPDQRLKAFKDLKKLAKTAEFEPLSQPQLLNWIKKAATELGGTIDTPAASYLIERAGAEQWNLSQNLQKLINYQSEVTRETIHELVEPVFEQTIFDLVEALARGNPKKALECYRGLRVNKAEPIYILTMIGWQLRNLLVVKAAEGRASEQIAKEVGMNPYVVNKSKAAAQNLDLKVLEAAYVEVQEADSTLKTMPLEPDVLLEQLIGSVANKFSMVAT